MYPRSALMFSRHRAAFVEFRHRIRSRRARPVDGVCTTIRFPESRRDNLKMIFLRRDDAPTTRTFSSYFSRVINILSGELPGSSHFCEKSMSYYDSFRNVDDYHRATTIGSAFYVGHVVDDSRGLSRAEEKPLGKLKVMSRTITIFSRRSTERIYIHSPSFASFDYGDGIRIVRT